MLARLVIPGRMRLMLRENERGRVVVAVSMAAEPQPQPATADGSSLLRTVGPDDVFNLPLYEHHLVMDIRPSHEYSRGHMATAVSFPYPPLQLVSVMFVFACNNIYSIAAEQ